MRRSSLLVEEFLFRVNDVFDTLINELKVAVGNENLTRVFESGKTTFQGTSQLFP